MVIVTPARVMKVFPNKEKLLSKIIVIEETLQIIKLRIECILVRRMTLD